MVQAIEQPISNSQMIEIAKFRLAVVQSNPVRSWEIGGVVQKFERGTNSSYGHYMASLGALVRHIFYDKRTIINYTLEGVLRRKEALLEAPEFIEVLQYEWNNNFFYDKFMPRSLECMGRIYKYMIQNVVNPYIEIDILKHYMTTFVSTTFGVLVGDTSVFKYTDEAQLKKLKESSYRKFSTKIEESIDLYKNFIPSKCRIAQDFSDYSKEEAYNDNELRTQALKKIILNVSHL